MRGDGRDDGRLDVLANAVRQTTQQLRSDQHDTIAQYVDRAADQLEKFSANIRDKEIDELLLEQAEAHRGIDVAAKQGYFGTSPDEDADLPLETVRAAFHAASARCAGTVAGPDADVSPHVTKIESSSLP
mgnify:CR=1 FL=1